MDREDHSQDTDSRSVGKADSGSKIVGSSEVESVESADKTASMDTALSCNAIVCSGYEASKEEVTQGGKASPTCQDSGFVAPNGTLVAESNYEESVEFDLIKHHNAFCPWVNGNVTAAGSTNEGRRSSIVTTALCGWRLTLDALDAFQSLGPAIQKSFDHFAENPNPEYWKY